MKKSTVWLGILTLFLTAVVVYVNWENIFEYLRKKERTAEVQNQEVDDFDSSVLQKFKSAIQEEKNNNGEWVTNLENLYERDRTLDPYRTVSVQQNNSVGEVSYTITDIRYTKNEEDLHMDPDALSPIEKDPVGSKEDGSLKEDWSYILIDTRIENTGQETIPVFYSYGYAMSIGAFDEEGEVSYFTNSVLYHSYQPGDSVQRALYRKAFAPGESFENTYILAVPDIVLNSLHIAIVVNDTGDGSYPVDSCYLMNVK